MSGTSYTRKPKSSTARCTEPDCKWVRMYWEQAGKMSPATRAELALIAHKRFGHKRPRKPFIVQEMNLPF